MTLTLSLLGCGKGSESDSKGGGEEPSTSSGQGATQDKSPPAATSDSSNPCDLLTEAIVRKHFKIADAVAVDQRLSNPGGHAHCSYNWNTLTPEEEAEQHKKMQEQALARVKNRHKNKGEGTAQSIADMAQLQNYGRGSAHLTMTKEMASEDTAVSALDSSRDYMEKRAKAKVGEDNVDFTSTFSDVAGIGNKAHYSAKMRQLSVAYGKRLYHLGATPDREGDSLELATALAKQLFP